MTATTEFGRLADTLTQEFARIYPTVRPVVRVKSTREAVVDLLNDSVRTILIDRPLNAEERSVADQAGIGLLETRIAWDAIVVAVNANNPVERISPRSIAEIVAGSAKVWSDIPGGRGKEPVEFVTTGRNSGLYEVIRERFTQGRALSVFAAGETQDELVAYVGRSPQAVTLVSLMAVRNRPATVKVLAVESPVDSFSGKTAFVAPGQLPVHTGEYGLRSELVVVNAERRTGPGVGFTSFVLTTPAQKIVQNVGLVPAVIPNRVIQLTSE
jgi:phosphate transport system substrate-binding protein